MDASTRSRRLRELALLFARLGATSFGGPAVHIAMMEDEIVRRRAWISREEFLDLVAASNIIPGPSSTELAIHIGHRRAGWPGLLVAGSCFIVPAMAAVLGVAWAYDTFGELPASQGFLYGVKAVVIAIVVDALWRLGRTALKSPLLVAVFASALTAGYVGIDEIAVLLVAGVFCLAAARAQRSRSPAAFLAPAALVAAPAVAAPFSLGGLFFVFAKIGALLFGSGYVLLAFLRSELVESRGWLTEQQLLDAIAAGQITPGPLFTTATFIGYILGGVPAALIATLGIFLPAFVFVAATAPFVARIRTSPNARAFLDGVTVASLALMTMVSLQLGRAAIVDVPTAVLAATSLAILIPGRINSVWLVIGGALLGLAAGRL